MRKPRTDTTKKFYLATGEKIAAARQRLGITQEALASDISLTRTAVVNIERGKQQLLTHTLVKISRALKIPAGELIPEISPDEDQSVLQVISNVVEDQKAREWMEKSLKSEIGRN